MEWEAFFYGFGIGFSLILAIGAQNAFVLRCGLSGKHVFWVCLTCSLADAILIAAGVSGFYWIIKAVPFLEIFARVGGAIFLAVYALRSFYRSFASNNALEAAQEGPGKLYQTLLICLAFTFLNPHVYLDTVFLIGSISAKFPDATLFFGMGAVSSSFVFFFSLGYGAIVLRPVFKNSKSWKFLDFGIGILMITIAAGLLLDLPT